MITCGTTQQHYLITWAQSDNLWHHSRAQFVLTKQVHRRHTYYIQHAPKMIPFKIWCIISLKIQKTIGIRKKRLCGRLRPGDKHHLRKSGDWKAQISPVSGTNAFLICAFRSADFLRWCLSPGCNLPHNLFFLFPIVFSLNLIHFLDKKKDSVQPEIRSF